MFWLLEGLQGLGLGDSFNFGITGSFKGLGPREGLRSRVWGG